MASPVCTELEVITMNWLGKLLGLPEEFLNCSSGPGGGVIQVKMEILITYCCFKFYARASHSHALTFSCYRVPQVRQH